MEHGQGPRTGGIDAALQAGAAQAHVLLAEVQGDPRRHADLPLHQVDLGEHLRDAVLYLQAEVHLHEPEAAIPVQQKL